jgi:hypothetical protein
MRPIIGLLFAVLTGSMQVSAQPILPDGRLQITVMPHYAQWHRLNATQATIDTSGTTHPIRGGYDSDDPVVIREHNQQFLDNGLVPAISWWGPAGSLKEGTGDLFWDLYLSIPSPVKGILLYEGTERLKESVIGRKADGSPLKGYDFNDPFNADQFVNDVEHLYAKYFSRPEYRDRFFLIDGKPAIFIWVTHSFTGRFDLAAARIPHRDNVFLIGSDFGNAPPSPGDTSVVAGLDAISSYGFYNPELAQQRSKIEDDRSSHFYGRLVGHIDAGYREEYEKHASRWSLWASRYAPKVKIILPLMFSFDNGIVFPLTSTPAEMEAFATLVQQMILKSVACGRNIRTEIIHVSHSEHYEGTAIEPSVEYGTGPLDTIRRTFKEPVVVPPVDCLVP